MIRIFVMGDAHIGKKYDRYPELKERLSQSRIDVLKDMVRKAEEEKCEFFVVTGDLFDSAERTRVSDVKKTAAILSSFGGRVIVLPGNHDYYSGKEKVWSDFEAAMDLQDHNITLIREFRPYSFEAGDEKAVFYPAFCQAKHSKTNNLSWIREAGIETDGGSNIGLAHGPIVGVSPDPDLEYFPMTVAELSGIPVDAWLIGHTHVPFPAGLREDEETEGYKIFNAGTHEQTDLHNNTDGNGFIITIEKTGREARVLARRYVSGKVHFRDLDAYVRPDSDTALEDAVKKAVSGTDPCSIVRLTLSGSARQEEYERRADIYRKLLGGFLTYETDDSGLSGQITVDKIRSEYAETSFAAKFLEKLTEDPAELQMAYELLKSCRED